MLYLRVRYSSSPRGEFALSQNIPRFLFTHMLSSLQIDVISGFIEPVWVYTGYNRGEAPIAIGCWILSVVAVFFLSSDYSRHPLEYVVESLKVYIPCQRLEGLCCEFHHPTYFRSASCGTDMRFSRCISRLSTCI